MSCSDCTDYWFDRSICPPPCSAMHYRCCTTGKALDDCLFEGGDDAPTP